MSIINKTKKGDVELKHPITTKDLGALNELIIFEQWAATKYKFLQELTNDSDCQKLFKKLCKEHEIRRDSMLKYLKSNAKAGEKDA